MDTLKQAIPDFIDEDRQPYNPKTSCASGKQNLSVDSPKLVAQYRYNRVRLVPDERPTQGRRPVGHLTV